MNGYNVAEQTVKSDDKFSVNKTSDTEQEPFGSESGAVSLTKTSQSEENEHQSVVSTNMSDSQPSANQTVYAEDNNAEVEEKSDVEDDLDEFIQFDFPKDDEEVTFEKLYQQSPDEKN